MFSKGTRGSLKKSQSTVNTYATYHDHGDLSKSKQTTASESQAVNPVTQRVHTNEDTVDISSALPDNHNGQVVGPQQLNSDCEIVERDDQDFFARLAAGSKALPYKPVRREGDLPMFRKVDHDYHMIGGLPSQMKKQAWLAELEFENDCYLKSYLLQGITEGFKIVDDIHTIPSYDNKNYLSVYANESSRCIDDLIKSELQEKKYIVSDHKPKCVHSLGAVPKSGGGYRPITDCSRPVGKSVNSFMETTASVFSYQTVDYVCELMQPGDYSASVDISSAYRSVSIFPPHRECQGIRWEIDGCNHYLLDTRLCFGIKSAPFIFTQISNFILRAMQRRGFMRIANYLDDYIIFDSSFENCQYAQSVLIHLLITLGFCPAWGKCSSPSTYSRYLGINFDSIRMELVLPEDKIYKLCKELDFFENKPRVTKKQVQKLAGYLAHCAKVVRGGRLFSRRVISLLKGLKKKKRITLPSTIRRDLDWWRAFMNIFNGSATIIRYNFGDGPMVWTDACITGYGVYSIDDWQAGLFNSELQLNCLCDRHQHWKNVSKPALCEKDDNVNFWELIAVWQAVNRLAPRNINCHIIIASDNTQVVAMINGNRSINISCLELLREIFWISAIHNVYITARFIPGVQNVIADRISRIYSGIPIDELRCLNLCCSYG